MTKKAKNQFINLANARETEQKSVMKDIADAKHCPFCRENLCKYHQQPILKEGQFWLVTTNQWPYRHTKHHFLLIYKVHAVSLSDLSPAAGQELFELIAEIEQSYAIKGGGLAMRFGDTDYSAGTISHLHVQLIEPDIESPNFVPVRIKIGRNLTED
ncbi:HIT family protein [Candidatus Woesebacteria bacterium]|jgi:diadenosine tetraphosphate (Ap4A) HIT family hydrolase|nr:HIT family protein [Candidatus Woesebacteria bacterium]HOA11993.1 HIT family protein [Candidatus Woesebacteria bacterium]HOC07401.1 HIT family protein [Candidatus Woesebacteria bacterium]HOI05465.1 HIT family protein [Candidatus Woesebacteria bacterium]HOP38685.1 HIT family protein [Candidatus Woesebacteria bacterium]